MKYCFILLAFLPLLVSCSKRQCYTCRKFAPNPNGAGTVYIGNEKICPENDNIYLVDPVPNDSTDLWECEKL